MSELRLMLLDTGGQSGIAAGFIMPKSLRYERPLQERKLSPFIPLGILGACKLNGQKAD